MSTDECRRRGRRTGAADSKAAAAAAETTAAATAYRSSNGDPQQQQRSQAAAPSFPSVCRLIEKYTMLIERHRQQQEVMTPSARKKPSSSSAAATNVGKVSGEPSAQDVSSSKSSDPFGEEAAAWNRLLMDREDEDDCNGDDEPSDDAENYRRPREQRPVPSSQEQHGEHRHPSLLRFGCKSLGNVLQHGSGDEEDSSKLTDDDPYEENVAVQSGDEERRRAQQLPVVCRLEVSKTAKVKRKRRKSWTGPTGGGRSQGHGDGGGPSRKGHSLDQGYDTVHHTRHHHHHHHHQQDFGLHHHHHYSALFRSYSNNNGGDATATAAATDSGVPGSRQFRTPSVVVSDHSEDPVSFSSMFTLDDLDELEARPDCAFNDSSSDCSAASTWSAAGSVISVLDAEYSLHTPERKISECSTCSTFGGADEDADEEQAAFRLSKLKPKHSGWRKLRNIVQWTPFFQTYKKQRYPWVQLAGHQGNFKAGPEPGTILKKLCPKEQLCFQVLMKDVLKPYVPEYKGHLTTDDGDLYLQLEDLLGDFTSPCVMDCKIGVRTYLEEELAKAKEKPKLRKDMYEKMIQIDPNAPSEEEHRLKGVTKPRYMVWRETISSTATLGFRIEGIKKSDGKSSKDFKTTKSRDQVIEAFRDFIVDFPHVIPKYISRLRAIRDSLLDSKFFATHEVIGSSLLFVHDNKNANVWLIDFAKTLILPQDIKINHTSEWVVGNHEDGYLIGINNLLDIFTEMNAAAATTVTFPVTLIEVTAPSEVA